MMEMKVPLSSPDISSKDVEAVLAVLRTPHLSMGPFVEKFEAAMARYVGTEFAVAVNSGTSGLHLSVMAAGIGEGHEVITTPFSFVASANCILYERATPIFVDIDPETLNMDAELVEENINSRTRAILPVHIFGLPCQMDVLAPLARRYGLAIIEDACESLGAESNGEKAGGLGDCAVFAFYPNKQMTTGEGGIIVTDHEEWARLYMSLRNQGRGADNQWLVHERVGYNYRLDEMSAALGLAQLGRIDELLAKRDRVAELYSQRLSTVDGVNTLSTPPGMRRSWFVYVVRLEDASRRDDVMTLMASKGIDCRPYFPPIHLQKPYVERFGYREGDFPVTEAVSRSTVALPFHGNLSEAEIGYVCDNLERAVNGN